MRYARILFTLWLVGSAEIVAAGGFLDSLRNFVAGPEAQAQPAPENPVDEVASGCLGCHNGSMPRSVNVRAARSVAPIHDFRANDDHPVGVVYEESVRKNPRDYRPATTLNPNIRLVDGRVTCITCHKVKNEVVAFNETWSSAQPANPQCTATHEVTTGQGDKELCLACHVM